MSAVKVSKAEWQRALDSIRLDRLHHAWLIAGVDGRVRRHFAERFAARILYPERAPDESVRMLRAGACADYFALESEASGTSTAGGAPKVFISMDRVRAATRFLNLKAGSSDRRVVLIDNLDLLTRVAPQVLLKTVEEPAPGGILIMICQQPRRILPALRSRCQTITMAPPRYEDLLDYAGNMVPQARTDALTTAWWLSAGAIDEAIALASVPALFEDIDTIISWMADPDILSGESGQKRLQAMTSNWQVRDRDKELGLSRPCYDHMVRAIFRLLATTCTLPYGDAQNQMPERIAGWTEGLSKILAAFPASSHPDVVENLWRLLKRGQKIGPNLPIAACLTDSIWALGQPQRLAIPSFIADPRLA